MCTVSTLQLLPRTANISASCPHLRQRLERFQFHTRGILSVESRVLRVNVGLRRESFTNCCTRGHHQIARNLLRSARDGGAGVTPEEARWSDCYNFRVACGRGHIQIVRLLLAPVEEGGAGISTKDAQSFHNDALASACSKGAADVVRLLLAPREKGGAGLGPEDVRTSGPSALSAGCAVFWHAYCREHIEVCRVLIDPLSDGGGGLAPLEVLSVMPNDVAFLVYHFPYHLERLFPGCDVKGWATKNL